MIGADNLINLSYHRSKQGLQAASNPYCMVFLYPNSPAKGEAIVPSAWRSRAHPNSLHPRWNATHTWNYCWQPPRRGPEPGNERRPAPSSPKLRCTQCDNFSTGGASKTSSKVDDAV